MCYNGSLSFHTLWPCSLGWLFLCLLVQSPSIIDWLKQQPTPVFLAGKSHGRRSLVGYTVHGIAESDTTERLHSLTPVRHFEWSINKIFAKPENGHSQHHGIKWSWNAPLKIMVKFMSKKGLCQLKTDTCLLRLQRLNHGHCNCWPSTPLKGVQGENQEWGTLCSGKNWQNRPSDS